MSDEWIDPVHLELDQFMELGSKVTYRKNIPHYAHTYTHVSFINLTKGRVRVKDQMGITRTVKQRYDFDMDLNQDLFRNREVVLVEVVVGIPEEDIDNVLMELKRKQHLNYLSKHMYNKLLPYQHTRGNATLVMIFEIGRFEIAKRGGVIYLPDLNITMSLGHGDDVELEHPNDPESKAKKKNSQIATAISNMDDDAIIVAMDAVDNSGEATEPDKYVSIGGVIYKLKVKRDVRSSFNGVRLRRRGALADGELSDNLVIQEYSFTEARDTLGVSDTVREAESAGDSKEAAIKRNQEFAESIKEREREFLRLKQEWEIDKQERESKLSRDKIEWERQKQEIERETALERRVWDEKNRVNAEFAAWQKRHQEDKEQLRKELFQEERDAAVIRNKELELASIKSQMPINLTRDIVTAVGSLLGIATVALKIAELFKKVVPA